MAYATGGSGLGLTDLMDALRVFALGEGWTIDKWDSANRLLFMTKGLCTVTMRGDTSQNVNVYYGVNGSNTFTSTPDHRIYFAMGTSNTAGSANYYGHPGSPVTSNYDSDAPYVNGLNGPYIGWFFFSDPTVSDHIHVVVQISAEVYKHFSIGHVDKKGLTHSGVAYVTAMPSAHYRNVSNWQNGSSGSFNDTNYQPIPFVYVPTQATFQPAVYDMAPPIILKHANAWPAPWLGPVAHANGASPLFGTMLPLGYQSNMYQPDRWPSVGSGVPRLLNLLVQAEPTAYSNVVPLFPIPVFRSHYNSTDNNSRRICYVGDFPNVRACNMTNLTPGQEITVDADTYKIFPAVRQSQWTDRLAAELPLSGQFGIAYKKVA